MFHLVKYDLSTSSPLLISIISTLVPMKELTIPRPSSIFPGPKRSEVTCPGNVQTDNATPIVPTISDARLASAATSARGRPQAAAAPAT